MLAGRIRCIVIYIYIYDIVDRKKRMERVYSSPPCRFVVRHTPGTSYIQCHDYSLLSFALPPRRIHIGNRPINPHSISFIRLVAGNARASCCTLLFFLSSLSSVSIIPIAFRVFIVPLYSPRDEYRGSRVFFFFLTF